MRVLVIENYPGTPLGQVGKALAEAGAVLDIRRAFAGDPLPADAAAHDGIVILGGGQNARDDAGSPFLPAVADLGRRFGSVDKAVLGICLGSQLIARAYGAENILGRPIEFGWHEVRPTAVGRDDPLVAALAGGAPIFHWHEDTFTLPPGAVHLASSDMTEFQAYRIGRAVYGIQFHFEADRALVGGWNQVFADEIAAHSPEWPDRFAEEAGRYGAMADAAGFEIARRWVGLI